VKIMTANPTSVVGEPLWASDLAFLPVSRA
jgi:hypothetical protein